MTAVRVHVFKEQEGTSLTEVIGRLLMPLGMHIMRIRLRSISIRPGHWAAEYVYVPGARTGRAGEGERERECRGVVLPASLLSPGFNSPRLSHRTSCDRRIWSLLSRASNSSTRSSGKSAAASCRARLTRAITTSIDGFDSCLAKASATSV